MDTPIPTESELSEAVEQYLTGEEIIKQAIPDRIKDVEFTATELRKMLGVTDPIKWIQTHEPDKWKRRMAHTEIRAMWVYRRERSA